MRGNVRFYNVKYLKVLPKGPSTHGEEYVDEVSAKDFSSPAKFYLQTSSTLADFVDEEFLI